MITLQACLYGAQCLSGPLFLHWILCHTRWISPPIILCLIGMLVEYYFSGVVVGYYSGVGVQCIVLLQVSTGYDDGGFGVLGDEEGAAASFPQTPHHHTETNQQQQQQLVAPILHSEHDREKIVDTKKGTAPSGNRTRALTMAT